MQKKFLQSLMWLWMLRDNFPTRYLLSDTCMKLGKPDVYGAICEFAGQVTVFASDGPCLRCLCPEAEDPSGNRIRLLMVLLGVDSRHWSGVCRRQKYWSFFWARESRWLEKCCSLMPNVVHGSDRSSSASPVQLPCTYQSSPDVKTILKIDTMNNLFTSQEKNDKIN